MNSASRSNRLVGIILFGLAAFFIFPFYWLTVGITKNVSQLFQNRFFPACPATWWTTSGMSSPIKTASFSVGWVTPSFTQQLAPSLVCS